MTTVTEQLIETLESEIEERRKIIANIKGLSINGHKTTMKASPTNRKRKWTPERRKKFMATLRVKRKAEAA